MASRRGSGEGSVFQRADGQWVGRVELGRDAEGKRVRRTVYGRTKRVALDKLQAATLAKAKHLPQLNDRTTVAQWLEVWLRDNRKLTATSRSTYQSAIDRWIIPAVGTVRLVKLSVADVESMTGGMLDRGLSASSAKAARRILSAALNAAMRADALHRNVAALADSPTDHRPVHRADIALTAAEADAVMAAARDDRLAALPVVLLTLGLRKGEALALRWTDITLAGDAPEIRVSSSLSRVAGEGLVRGTTKTVGSERTIPLVEPALSALQAHQRAQRRERMAAGVWEDDGIVFATTWGTYVDPRNALRAWHGWTEAAGLGQRRMHASRHTTATLLLNRGVPLAVVSAVLGHASLAITADIYSKVSSDLMRRGMTANS